MMTQLQITAGYRITNARNALPSSSLLKRLLAMLWRFTTLQVALQMTTAVVGFFLLRWLTVEQFAQYSLAFSFQTTMSLLADVGITGSIVALVGPDHSPQKLSGLVDAACLFRNRMLLIVAPPGSIAFWFAMTKQGWPVGAKVALTFCIIAGVFFQGISGCYAAPLLITRRFAKFYGAQIGGTTLRAISTICLHAAGLLSSVTGTIGNIGAMALTSFLNRKYCREMLPSSKTRSPTMARELTQYLLPLAPAVIYFALQGQITTLIIAFTGQTRSIAEIGALGRLGQLFALLGATTPTLVGPFIAKLPAQELKRKCLLIVSAAIVVGTIPLLIALALPGALLWLLGPHYAGLAPELPWSVSIGSAAYASGVVWTINQVRKWISWRVSLSSICLALIVQTIGISAMDLSRTVAVIKLSLSITIATSVPHCIAAGYHLALSGSENNPRAPIPTLL